ncbi:hypothetical protein QM012_004634 [Aureobasidium pullulans]|uniref:Uncharacterized protein n=1 Tax=Aureobasidium pullulans TaxID=5580 RepID=A0ABR0TVE3_AURPU
MTYTRIMYDMPPNKVGENTGFWQLPRDCKPAGALAAACVVNKTFPDVYQFLEETFWEIVRNEELAMERDPITKTPKWARYILRIFGLSFLYEYEDLTAKDRAHRIFPMFEEISDEEWLRRAAPIHYPYHTPGSQEAYNREMAFRQARRVREWEERCDAYKRRLKIAKRIKRIETKLQEPEDFSDCGSFASDSSFHSDSDFDSISAESVLDKLCATLRSMYKRGVKPSDPEFIAVLEKAEDVNDLIEFDDESIADTVSTTEEINRMGPMRDPNWKIKLDEKMDLTLLDFDNDPFLSPADEEYLDDVQDCFDIRDMRIAEEIICRIPKLLGKHGKEQHKIQKDREEYKRLMILYGRLKERLDASIHGISSDGQPVEDEDSTDDNENDDTKGMEPKNSKSGGDGDDSDEPENQPDWLRTVSKKVRLIIEAPDMNVNPNHVGLSFMTDDEEEEYFARYHHFAQTELESYQTEEERQERMAQEIKDKGDNIQWLRTRDREDFPTLARISTSTQAASPPVPTEGAFEHRQDRSMEQEVTPRFFDGQTLKCFSAGPHHTREPESLESSPASSVKKRKSLLARGVKKIKSLRRKTFFCFDNSSEYTVYGGSSTDSV